MARQTASTAPSARRYRTSISTALAISFGGLMGLGMAIILAISMWSAQKNTRELLSDKASLAVASLTRETRRRLAPMQDATEYVAGLIAAPDFDANDDAEVRRLLTAAQAGVAQAFGMAFIRPSGRVVRIRRGGTSLPPIGEAQVSASATTLQDAESRSGSYWGTPIWLPGPRRTAINVRTPVYRDGVFLGIVVGGVTVDALSRFIARSGTDPEFTRNRFILYGDDYVLAHRNMSAGGYNRNEDVPLPRLGEVGDGILARIWDETGRRRLPITLAEGTGGHIVNIEGEQNTFLYRKLEGFGPVPLTIGIYAGPEERIGLELRRLSWAGAAGLVVLALSIAGAVVIGRRMSRPVRALARGSRVVANLTLEDVPLLGGSRLREIDEASSAFNSMVSGLRWFETYVPRRLVHRLIARNAMPTSEEKEVTIMFTDITGFSTLAERRDAAEIATLLNAHFSLVAGCIEAHEGTVDKYIGDSVMAFWEPGAVANPADQAVAAAIDIRAAVSWDNRKRRERGEAPILLRIGIHTGPAIVGNIGAPGRMNYTLVGDTVNVAARLEELCREVGGDGDVTIMVSGETEEATTGLPAAAAHIGQREVRGRDAPVDVFSI